MTIYDELLPVVVELIDETGRVVTFERLTATPADASKPWRGPAAPTAAATKDLKATFVPPSGTEFGKDWISSDLLARCEQVCLVAPDAMFDLNGCTSILDGAVRWAVQWIYALRPGDINMLFAVGVKR